MKTDCFQSGYTALFIFEFLDNAGIWLSSSVDSAMKSFAFKRKGSMLYDL